MSSDIRITQLEPFILHVPVTRSGIADSTHSISHWGVVGCRISTDAGIVGYGYTGTHADLASDRLIRDCLSTCIAPLLVGKDPLAVQELWKVMAHHSPLQWVGRMGLTHVAIAAADVALWDIKAKHAGQSLWKLLGGSAETRIEGYNTDGGWLNWDDSVLVDDCRQLVQQDGYRGVKIKVGSTHPAGGFDVGRDLRRVEAVRKAIGPQIKLMIDANGRFDLPTAMRFGRRLVDFDVMWFEEPIWYDNVSGHRALAQSGGTPVALGEQLYRIDQFKEFLLAGAVHYVQPDAVRLGGITEWWQTADLAHAFRLPVVAHVGDMMQIHLPLSIAHPACTMLEYIPWIRECFEEPATVKDGSFIVPQQPGANTTLRAEAFEKFARQ